MYRVLSRCPNTGETIATYAVMKPVQFARFGGSLAVYCTACQAPHVLGRQDLVLEDRELPEPQF